MSTDKNREYLETWEREVVLFVERYHSVNGSFPDNGKILNYLSSLGLEATEDKLVTLKDDFLFKESLKVRGLEPLKIQAGQLTPKQMLAVAKMLDIVDRRSDEKKLRDLGITTEEWANWMLDETFSSYVTARAERMIATYTHEAHMGLMRGIRSGNTKAIELYYELTGRYTKNQDSNVNVRQLIGQILEIIQKHEKNPQVLNAMAVELSQLAIETNANANRTTIKVGPQPVGIHKSLDF